MRKSEVFDEFLKIATQKGILKDNAIVSTSAKKDDPPKSKATTWYEVRDKILKDPNHRADAISLEQIQNLYNNKSKNDDNKEHFYQYTDQEPSVLFNAHDKINGLLASNDEQNNIIYNIVMKNKMPRGTVTSHRYAQNDLALTLKRTATHLDNLDETDLASLADTCLLQMSKQANPLAIGAIAAAAALIGALYYQQHADDTNQGFEINHKNLISQIDDFINSSITLGVGVEYEQSFINSMKHFKDILESFYKLYQGFTQTISSVDKPKTTQELQELATSTKGQQLQDAYNKLNIAFQHLDTYIEQISSRFKDQSYQLRQIKDKGMFNSLVDKVPYLHGDKSLIANDFEDVIHALAPYEQSIKSTLDLLKTSNQKKEEAQQLLAKQQENISENPVSTNNNSIPNEDEIENLNKQFDSEVGNLG